MRLSTTTSVLVLVVAAFALAACAPLRVNSFTDTRANLPGYRTYTWDPAGPGATGDPRLDNNRFFRERIVAAVDRELSAKGFERTAGPADDRSLRTPTSWTMPVNISAIPRVPHRHLRGQDFLPQWGLPDYSGLPNSAR